MAAPRVMVLLVCGFLLIAAAVVLAPQTDSAALAMANGDESRAVLPVGRLSRPSEELAVTVQADVWIDEYNLYTNYGGDTDLRLGYSLQKDGKLYRDWILLAFDISKLPAGASVNWAEVRLTQNGGSGYAAAEVWAEYAAEPWVEGAATWYNQPASSDLGDAKKTMDFTFGEQRVDATEIVRAWVGGSPVYGILLKVTDKDEVIHRFDAGTATLVIDYTVPVNTDTPTPTNTPTHTPTPTPTDTVAPPQAFTDLGDAPDSSNSAGLKMDAYPGVGAEFPTVYGAGSPPIGPLHRNQPLQYFLGPYVSVEFEADSGYDEDTVNNLQPALGQANLELGDDGVDLPATWDHCKLVQLTFHVTSSVTKASNAKLNIWADWNGDGSWGNDVECDQNIFSEWAVQNAPVAIPGYGVHTFTTPAFRVYRPDETKSFWLRVTLSDIEAKDADGSGPAGGWADGETEDYLIAGGEPPTATPTTTATVTATATATPTTPVGPSFGLTVAPSTVDLNIDPIVGGEVDRVEASAQVVVTRLQGTGSAVSLSIKDPPSWLTYAFTPASGSPTFQSQLVLSISRSALPEPDLYTLIVRGTTATEAVTAEITLRVLRTLYGDLAVISAEAVQAVESRALAAALIRDKATAFKVKVTSSFPSMVNVYFRLVLPPAEWDSPLVIWAPTATGAAATAPAAPQPSYPEVWGPYKIYPGEHSLWLPYVPDTTGRVDLTTNPAGIIAGQCRGGTYWQCTIDTRHAPRPIAATVHFTVAIDPANALIEVNEGNNSYSEPGWPAVSTRPWRFYFIPSYRSDEGRRQIGENAKRLVEYLVATHPIADTKVSYTVSYSSFNPPAGQDRTVFLPQLLEMANMENYDYVVNASFDCGGGASLAGMRATRFGGVCVDPDTHYVSEWQNTLAHEFTHGVVGVGDAYSLDTLVAWEESYCEYRDNTGALRRQYCVHSNTPIALGSVSEYCTQTSRDVQPSCSGTITKQRLVDCHCSYNEHERGGSHACTETPAVWMNKQQCRDACEVSCDALHGTTYGAPDNRAEHPAGAGMWVNKWVPITSQINSFMDSAWSTVQTFPYFWQTLVGRYDHANTPHSIMNDGWVNITNSATFRRATDPEALLVSGSVTAAGAATFRPFMRLPEANLDLEPGSTGTYELRLVGAGSTVLSRAGFELSFEQPDPYGGPIDEAPFVYRIEWVTGTQAVELWSGGERLAQRLVSANAPELALQSPQGGKHRSSVHVSWTASDDDGDALTFALSVSSDGGQTWGAVALDLTGNSYELSLDGVPAGANYRLKLRATDGVNTTQVISQPFTVEVEQPVYLPLVIR